MKLGNTWIFAMPSTQNIQPTTQSSSPENIIKYMSRNTVFCPISVSSTCFSTKATRPFFIYSIDKPHSYASCWRIPIRASTTLTT